MKYFKYLSLVIVILAILLLVGERLSIGNEQTKKEELTKAELWKVVNQWRNAEGYNIYEESEYLCNLASIRVKEIKIDFSHAGFRRLKSEYQLAENLAEGYTSANFTLNGWLKSASHSANLRATYKYSCIIVEDNYAVQLFSNLVSYAPINKVVIPTYDPDPLVNCVHDGKIELKRRSQCSYVNCEINGQWHKSSSEDECRRLQIEANRNDTNTVQSTSYKDEVMDCHIGNQVYRYTYDECINKQNEYFKTLN